MAFIILVLIDQVSKVSNATKKSKQYQKKLL